MKAIGINGKFLEYKGKPLVRQGNELYYGDMSDKYYLFMMIMAQQEDPLLHATVPTQVMIQILSTANDEMLEGKQKVLKNLYEAFDLGTAWLERANKS